MHEDALRHHPTATGTISVVTADPKLGENVVVHVESDDPNLFVHLVGTHNGNVVYQEWQRCSDTAPVNEDVTMSPLNTPPLMAAGGAAFQAKLEDWSNYGLTGKYTQIAEADFTV